MPSHKRADEIQPGDRIYGNLYRGAVVRTTRVPSVEIEYEDGSTTTTPIHTKYELVGDDAK